jgi:uncharacterized peroxidase-related enzyme
MFSDSKEADSYVHAIANNFQSAPLSPQDRALCEFAKKLTMSPNEMSPTDLDQLREQGFNDLTIHDAVQVISYFNYINRVAESLGVEPENFIRPWGET